MNFGAILAGGSGTRMGADADLPKQFLPLGSAAKPILIHTVEAFINSGVIHRVVIAVPAEWVDYTQDLISTHIAPDYAETVDVIEGGSDRAGSLECICLHIMSAYGAADGDIVVSHDAVRPFVTTRIIKENIALAEQGACVDTVVPATDTIVMSADGVQIDDIPPRSHFFQGQTPQSFPLVEYIQIYEALSAEQRSVLTDACKVYLMAGKPVLLVTGEYDNIKVTTKADLAVAEAILARQGGAKQ